MLLIRLPGGSAALGAERFDAESVAGSKAWVLALQQQGESLPGLPVPPPGAGRFVVGEDDWPEVHWDSLRLGCLYSPRARDWAWAWSPTYGPVCLTCYVAASAAEIAAWLEKQSPGVWLPSPDGWYRSRWSDDCRLQFTDQRLCLTRGHQKPCSRQVESDYEMLLELSRGELGPLEFDLWDGDYYYFVASGSGSKSLRDYLHARAGAGKKHRWNRFLRWPPIDARADGIGQCLKRLAEGLGGRAESEGELATLLASLSVHQVPRHLTVVVSPSCWDEQMFARLARAQPRLSLSWRLGGAEPAADEHRAVPSPGTDPARPGFS